MSVGSEVKIKEGKRHVLGILSVGSKGKGKAECETREERWL